MICDEWIDSLSLKALLTALSIWLLATNVIVEYFKCRNKEILTTKPILEKGSFVELLLWRPDDFFTELKHFPPTCQPKETRKRENRLNLPNRRKNYARKSHLTLSSHNFRFDCGHEKCRAEPRREVRRRRKLRWREDIDIRDDLHSRLLIVAEAGEWSTPRRQVPQVKVEIEPTRTHIPQRMID